ncbi:MAG: hypothetical protein RMJ35_08790, partial [Phycisphaerales bacterium]|nr:hypothetical protein [Phycisphaerales bacterium]
DFINVGEVEVGMIATRSTVGMETRLTQRALVRASDLLYFNFSLVSPAPRKGRVEDDPECRRVVDLFGRIIDTVSLIDQERIKEEQAQRLYRTRLLLMRFNETNLRNALVPEQWWRLQRDGKDIGYSYVVEEVASDLPRRGMATGPDPKGNGVRVGVRSRAYPEPGVQVDTETWIYVSFDRRNEVWSNIGVISGPDGKKEEFGEFGFADREIKRVLDPQGEPGEQRPDGSFDAGQPPLRVADRYTLSVTRTGHGARPPREIDLPPFYLPQALNHLLCRLVDLNEPKTFLFASWISDRGEVMKRYIDVGAETTVTLDGKKLRAIPIRDRVGYEGSPTVHYMSPDRRYLGAVNEESRITILASDKATLERIWKNADLTRPGVVERK